MKGVAKGTSDRILIQAYHNEMMARQKRLKRLDYYFQSEKDKADEGVNQVRSLFKRMIERKKQNGK